MKKIPNTPAAQITLKKRNDGLPSHWIKGPQDGVTIDLSDTTAMSARINIQVLLANALVDKDPDAPPNWEALQPKEITKVQQAIFVRLTLAGWGAAFEKFWNNRKNYQYLGGDSYTLNPETMQHIEYWLAEIEKLRD